MATNNSINNTGKNIVSVIGPVSIDGKSTGATVIGTTNATQRFVPLNIIIEPTVTSAVVGVSSISVGTNSASYDNLFAIAALTGITATNMFVNLAIALLSSSIAPSTAINLKVTSAATATTYTFNASVVGFYY